MRKNIYYLNKIVSFIIAILTCVPFIGVIALEPKEETKSNAENLRSNFIICIDPGHQSKGDSKGEPVAPGAYNLKPRVSSGTKGVGTKRPEYIVNLEAATILKELLQVKGYKVVMTRETNDLNISNIERAEIANNANANIAIRIHCDGLNDSSKRGATILIPSKESKCTSNIYDESKRFGEILKDELKSSNIKVNGVIERRDITGFNWSKVPVVILEMGFMSNWEEDRMLSDPSYQKKLMDAVANSIEQYQTVNTN